jgi:hypothetical protein
MLFSDIPHQLGFVCRGPCKEWRPLSEYRPNKQNKSGHAYQCNKCSFDYLVRRRLIWRDQNLAEREEGLLLDDTRSKRCQHCRAIKPVVWFYRDSHRKGGYGGECVACTLLRNARSRSKEMGIPSDLALEDIVIPERCPVLGIPLLPGSRDTEYRFRNPGSPTVDRIRPELGYVKGNVKIISWLANRIKSDCSDPEVFEKIAAYLRANQSLAG